MSKLFAFFRHLLTEEPALTAWVTSGGLAALLGFAFHLPHTREAAVAVILASLATVWTAIFAHPPEVPLLTGALVTIAGALAAFGYHLPSHTVAIGTAVLAVVMALLHRANLEPWLSTKPPAAPGK